ncbi:MAG: DUF4249 domain-containing protein [Cyclobacteriaceae bacterium]|nr:DUF4249 domain-containing protein [Cyclobacteriaceae bacterium HetDA_MAG_MS6]
MKYLAIGCFAVFASCVQQIDQDFPEGEVQLVVEGSITTEPGPYYVYIRSSESLEGLERRFGIGSGGIVTISDDEGNSEQLTEVSTGVYMTNPNGIRGEIGRTYKININLRGVTYESLAETIPDPGAIDSLQATFQATETTDDKGVVTRSELHVISSRVTTDLGQNQYFKIDAEGYAEVFVAGSDCPAVDFRNCWQVTESLVSGMRLQDNLDLSRGTFRIDAVNVPFNGRGRYYVLVKLASVTERAYNFFSAIQQQLERGDNIFQAPIPPTRGNVINTSTGTPVFGYFNASSISKARLCFDRRNVDSRETFVPRVLCPGCGGLFPPPCFETCVDVYSNAVFFPPLPTQDCE